MEDTSKAMIDFFQNEAKSLELDSPALDKKYWKLPHLNAVQQGDDKDEAIFTAVGLSLTMFENLENTMIMMYMVFCEIHGSSSYMAIRRSIGTLESSAGRRSAIIAAAKVYFGDYEYSKGYARNYKVFFEAHDEASKRRNDIAHGMVHSFQDNNDFKGHFLFPAGYNSGRNHLKQLMDINSDSYLGEKYRLTSKDIYEYAGKFGDLNKLAMTYVIAANKINGYPKVRWMKEHPELIGNINS